MALSILFLINHCVWIQCSRCEEPCSGKPELKRHMAIKHQALVSVMVGKFAKVANAGFQNYRPRRTFWYIETNVVLRRPPTPISKLPFGPYLLQ